MSLSTIPVCCMSSVCDVGCAGASVSCASAHACGRPWDVVKVTFGLGLVVVWVVVLVVVLVMQMAQMSNRSAPDNAWPGGGRVSWLGVALLAVGVVWCGVVWCGARGIEFGAICDPDANQESFRTWTKDNTKAETALLL